MQWEIYYVHQLPGRALFLDTLRQASGSYAGRRFAAAKICGQTYIDRSGQNAANNRRLASPAI